MLDTTVNHIGAGDLLSKKVRLSSDLASEYPVYMYAPKDGKSLYVSKSLKALLDSDHVVKPVTVSSEGLSFFLQCSLVPPPQTIYEDIFVLGIGDSVSVSCENDRIRLEFKHVYPFPNIGRPLNGPDEIDLDTLLELIASATISRIDESRPSFLFHSAGKDSNAVAIALAEAGWQEKVTLVTFRSPRPDNDETEIARSIARKLGFKHRILEMPQLLDLKQQDAIVDFVREMPIMCQDMQIAYPLFSQDIDFRGSNLIDGLGAEAYIGYVLPRQVYRKALWFSGFSWLQNIPYADLVPIVRKISRTRAEWTGFPGLSFRTSRKLYQPAVSAYPFLKRLSDERRHWDFIDFTGDTRGTMTDSQAFIQKLRNASYVYDCNLVLPWADSELAQYVYSLPEEHVFDRHKRLNKTLLRKLLLERISLDSTALGKKAFGFSLINLWQSNSSFFKQEIENCMYWSGDVAGIVDRLTDQEKMDLFFLSAWLNKCKYISS